MTSMVWALRPQLRYVVRQSVRRSFATAAPLVPRAQDWVQWAQQARWANYLNQEVVRSLLAMTTPAWLATWRTRPSTPGTGTPGGAPAGGSDRPAGRSRRLSVADLLWMIINEPGKYVVHRTYDRDVGELREGTVIDARYPAGTDDNNAPAGIYVIPGLVGVPYGDLCVLFEKVSPHYHFGSLARTADAPNANKEELLSTESISVEHAVGCYTAKDAEEAKSSTRRTRRPP
ncbi:hypothetical protein [Lentzea sp. HUAS12]|uniref:hypothetical protein n=1 Tax=Lentzea sp. HUAS12 TaxID=2951806 RepID=UPI0020A0A2EB|nr:hypothetical protein [Lentzea sp. HUAS12]USX52877.1 hypothetical protein ND450_01905 [Lentzea sp. HUAS12]